MVVVSGLNIDQIVFDTVARIVAGTGFEADAVFEKFAEVLSRKHEGTDQSILEHNRALLNHRDVLQGAA